MDKNRNLRTKCAATGFVVLLFVAEVGAQTTGKPQARAGIVGTVFDEQARPQKNISVHAVSDKTGMYIPTVDSNEAGHFVIENLEPGTYSIVGESDADAYPNTGLSFYPNENPIKVTLGNFGTANVVLVRRSSSRSEGWRALRNGSRQDNGQGYQFPAPATLHRPESFRSSRFH